MKKLLSIILALFAGITIANAVIAYPEPVTVTQPDGTVLTIRIHGDEFLHWTTCGNSLVSLGSDGYWRYASFDSDGTSKVQGDRVTHNLSGDGTAVRPPASAIAKALEKRKTMMSRNAVNAQSRSGYSVNATKPPISTGQKRFLILLIQFSDKSFTKTKQNFYDMLNSSSYNYNNAYGSVNKYYNDVSFGDFDPIFDVYGPITVSYTSAQCADEESDYILRAVKQACNYANDNLNVDFTKYCNANSSEVDNVFFFFPGYNQAEGGGSSTIWPHAATYYDPFLTLDGKGLYKYGCTSEFKGSSGSTMAGIGTFCHEFGHVIGLPDFYDVDYEDGGEGEALGSYSLMSSGNYNNSGKRPPYLTYEEKHILGWDDGLTLLSEGSNTLLKTSNNKTYYNPTSTSGEYYLYESRPQEKWDEYTEAGGMVIYHIDKSDYAMPNGYTAAQLWEYGYMINAYASHQCMDLVESVYPESSVSSSDRVFPGQKNVKVFSSTTTPSATSWAGVPTGYNLSNISFNSTSGETSFTVEIKRGIGGNVKKADGQAVSGLTITAKYVSSIQESSKQMISCVNGLSLLRLTPTSNPTEYTTVTDANGHYELELSQTGIYSLSAKMEGYYPYSSNVTVTNDYATVNITLNTPAEEASTKLQKYDFISGSSIGYGVGVDHYAGLKYTSSELSGYVGHTIKSISFMAENGGTGTVDKMGVKVYFDSNAQCDCECTPVFGTMNTVDLSGYNLQIPSGKSVTFVYYQINPSYGYPVPFADEDTPVTGGNLINDEDNTSWSYLTYGNCIISAYITDGAQVIELAGFNYIPHAGSYNAGDNFNLTLHENSINPPSTVEWTVNGEPATGPSVTLVKGVCTIQAHLTYPSGRTEIIEAKLNVK